MKVQLYDNGEGINWEMLLTAETLEDAAQLTRLGMDHKRVAGTFDIETMVHEKDFKTWFTIGRRKMNRGYGVRGNP